MSGDPSSAIPHASSSQPLPPSPNLQFYKKQAKALQKAHKAGNLEACARIGQHLPRLKDAGESEILAAPFALADAQLVIAREYGFGSWTRFKRHIESITTSGIAHCRPSTADWSYYEDRAAGLLSVYQSGLESALRIIGEFHPRFAGLSEDEIRRAEFTLEDAVLVYAREHGFESSEAFKSHIEALARGERTEPFLAAFEAIKQGDLDRLRELLQQDPSLVNARGTNGNTLLNLAGSCKQLAISRLLVEEGADVDLANDRGWTPLHQAAYSSQPELADMLLEAGASVGLSAHGDGGTPLVQALFWGHSKMADRLAAHGVIPCNLRVAAGLGKIDLARSLFTPDGTLKPEAGAHREFYRPHSGFPVWTPSNHPQEILDEALVWACKNNRLEILDFLVERGADLDGDPYRGTGLVWAACTAQLEVARWLLDHGADVNRRATFGGPGHGVGITALHLAAQNGKLEMVKFLVERGADTTIRDQCYNSPPWGWAEHSEHLEVRDYLLESASQTDLMAAIAANRADRVEGFLAADPGAVNQPVSGIVPLNRAIWSNRPDMLRLLLARGANPNLKAREADKSPLAEALAHEREEMVEVLQRHGAVE